ncbi:MAG TPA: hypothetical protein VK135_06925 [Candidatus Dormibacteraeota bacterium]|nr:hypothetical protein [Candidatus Dormibacteraeota bacterium]
MLEYNVVIISDDLAVTRVIENLASSMITHSEGNIVISLKEQDSMAILVIKNDTQTLTELHVNQMFDRLPKSFMEKMNGMIYGNFNEGELSIICEWEIAKNK